MFRTAIGFGVAILAAVAAWAAAPAPAQEAAPPPKGSDAEALRVISSALEAHGGADAYRRRANHCLVYRAETLPKGSAASVEFELTTYGRSDGAQRVEKRIQNEKEIIAFDGKEYWWVASGRTDAEAAPPAIAAWLRLEALQQNLLARYEALGYVAQFRAPEAGATSLERVIFTRAGAPETRDQQQPGDRFQFWFDTKSHLVARIATLEPTLGSGKAKPKTVHLHDYVEVDGFLIAKRMVVASEDKEVLEATLVREKSQVGKAPEDALFRKP